MKSYAVRRSSVSKLGTKLVIGILGGIGSGKSTVAAEFGKLGCAVIDADKIAHKLLDEAETREKIFSVFGKNISNKNDKIDRHKLAQAAFRGAEELEKLAGILHPPVLAEVERQVQQLQEDTTIKAIVVDMPLLAEVGWDKRCDTLIFVHCDEEKRLKRAEKIGLFEPDELKKRENFQISLDRKASIAENIVNNNSDLSALARQVAEIFPKIVRNG
jgi:dephospho-CoA kinase